MNRIQQLAKIYGQHIATAWQRTIAGPQRVIMIVYDKELERDILAHKTEFEIVTKQANHDWFEVDVASAFAEWMAAADYRDSYFESPDDLQLKLEAEFTPFVAARIRSVLEQDGVTQSSVVAVFGVGALFGFTRASQVLKLLESSIHRRLVVFFPGLYDQNNYRLLDARDGWNYLAVPITLNSAGVS
jgi:Domain of unknown function (DUF1788)